MAHESSDPFIHDRNTTCVAPDYEAKSSESDESNDVKDEGGSEADDREDKLTDKERQFFEEVVSFMTEIRARKTQDESTLASLSSQEEDMDVIPYTPTRKLARKRFGGPSRRKSIIQGR